MQITVLLADDHEIFRTGVRHMLETDSSLRVVAETSSGLEAVGLAQKHHPQVAVLDVRMPDLNGIAAIPRILLYSPGTAILMLSMYADKQYVRRSVAAGARGYLLKDSAHETLIRAIKLLHDGQSYFTPSVAPFASVEPPPDSQAMPFMGS